MGILFRCETLKDEAAYAYRRHSLFLRTRFILCEIGICLVASGACEWRQTKKIVRVRSIAFY